MRRYAVVRVAWDDEAKVWYVEKSDIDGLATEADTLEELRRKVPIIIQDLLEGARRKSNSTSSPTLMTVCGSLRESRHSANVVLKQAGLPKAF